MRNGYNNAWSTTLDCPHKISYKNRETGEIEYTSTWYKYQVERYHGKVEKCSLCKQKRVMDLSGEEIQYIEQASLF